MLHRKRVIGKVAVSVFSYFFSFGYTLPLGSGGFRQKAMMIPRHNMKIMISIAVPASACIQHNSHEISCRLVWVTLFKPNNQINRDISFLIELKSSIKSIVREENVKEVDVLLCIFSLDTGFGHSVDRYPDNQPLLDKEYWLILAQDKNEKNRIATIKALSEHFQNTKKIFVFTNQKVINISMVSITFFR